MTHKGSLGHSIQGEANVCEEKSRCSSIKTFENSKVKQRWGSQLTPPTPPSSLLVDAIGVWPQAKVTIISRPDNHSGLGFHSFAVPLRPILDEKFGRLNDSIVCYLSTGDKPHIGPKVPRGQTQNIRRISQFHFSFLFGGDTKSSGTTPYNLLTPVTAELETSYSLLVPPSLAFYPNNDDGSVMAKNTTIN